jgi:hypothetical protein
MSKTKNRWVLYTCVEGEITPLSRPFKTKVHAEKAREKYSKRERKTIGIGVFRLSLKPKV